MPLSSSSCIRIATAIVFILILQADLSSAYCQFPGGGMPSTPSPGRSFGGSVRARLGPAETTTTIAAAITTQGTAHRRRGHPVQTMDALQIQEPRVTVVHRTITEEPIETQIQAQTTVQLRTMEQTQTRDLVRLGILFLHHPQFLRINQFRVV